MMSRGFTAVLKYWFKDLATSISSATVFPPSNKEIFVVLTPLSERGLTVFQKSFLLVILFKSRLSLLQKFYCHLKSFKFSLDLVLKYLCCSSVLFIIAFLIGFDIWCMISSDCFVFNWSMSSQNFKKDFFKNMLS